MKKGVLTASDKAIGAIVRGYEDKRAVDAREYVKREFVGSKWWTEQGVHHRKLTEIEANGGAHFVRQAIRKAAPTFRCYTSLNHFIILCWNEELDEVP